MGGGAGGHVSLSFGTSHRTGLELVQKEGNLRQMPTATRRTGRWMDGQRAAAAARLEPAERQGRRDLPAILVAPCDALKVAERLHLCTRVVAGVAAKKGAAMSAV